MKKIENIVYSGSGSLLPAFVGSTDELFNHVDKTQIKRICATSGGSIYAFLLVINEMNTKAVENLIMKMDFSKFFDNSFGFLRDSWRLLWKGGWNEGNEVLLFLSDCLKYSYGRSDISFLEFFGKFGIDLTIVVTNAELAQVQYCNSENTPGLSVIEAVRRSMSIPLIFVPRKDDQGTYIDGGVTDNFAITFYDYIGKPENTIGFKLREKKGKVKREKVNGLISIIGAVRRCWLRSPEENDNTGIDRIISIYDCEKSGLDPLDEKEKKELIASGREEVLKWVARNVQG